MGLRSIGAATEIEKNCVSPQPVSANEPRKSPYDLEQERKVRGQVAMNAIIAGYDAASRVAPIVGTGPDSVIAEMHRIAGEIAAKVEEYTFREG